MGYYRSTNDPQELAANQRELIDYRGNQLGGSADREMEAERLRRQQTGSFLNEQYTPMAEGRGGYSATESQGIMDQAGLDSLDPNAVKTSADFFAKYNMTPQQEQDMVTGAGITAGNRYRSAIGSMERGARAAGMSPMGVGAYRARMEREGAGEAADAMTKARVDASNAAANRLATGEALRQQGESTAFNEGLNKSNVTSGRNQTLGDTRLGQQAQGLNYYQNQNNQASENANQAANRAANIYGTQANAGNEATKNQMTAPKLPSTFQKVMGGVSGALQLGGKAASFLEDGGIIDRPTLAVVGENGPEVVAPLYRANPKVRPSVVMETARRQPRFYGAPPIENGSALTNPIAHGENLKPRDTEAATPLGGYRAYADTLPSAAMASGGVRRQPRYYGQAA